MCPIRLFISVVAALIGLLVLSPVYAITFLAGIEETRWQLQSSRFECRLTHTIPAFGDAVFEHRAGESLKFMLNSDHPEALVGDAILVAEAPTWRPGSATWTLAQLQLGNRNARVQLDHQIAKGMMTALYQGMSPTFNTEHWYGGREPMKVGLSSANFQAAYGQYVGCVAQLLPVNYNQIARSAALFPSGRAELSDAAKRRLDLIATYVNADSSVNSIYIDGHTDNVGRRLANRDLSKQRAENVSRYLAKAGVPEEIITTRYHGERYPVVSNNKASNRARNRRVTIRLERE